MFEQSDSSLSDLTIQFNNDGWGPVLGAKLPIFEGVPYAHFDKNFRMIRPADFVSQNVQTSHPRFQRKYDNFSTDFAYRHDAVEDSTFQLVDTGKAFSKNKSGNSCDKNLQRKNI
jgi:hypothetical protein